MQYDIDNSVAMCEQEKLHYSNAIQPFGVLLAINAEKIITHASVNAPQLLEINIEQILGKPISAILGKSFSIDSGTHTTLQQRRLIIGVKLAWNKTLDISITDMPDGHIIELQSFHKKPWFSLSRVSDIATAIVDNSVLSYKHELKDLMLGIARKIRNLSGYTKAMVYQFHDDWSGEVMAEIGGEKEFDSYLGLRFPASDIPKIARDIYLKTPYRLIPDVAASSVPVVSMEDVAKPLDLTYADLRSVSPLHITYMKNMQVGASFSLPIIVDNQLWGLVALHHPTSLELKLDVRNECAKAVAKFNLALRANISMQRVAINTSIAPKIHTLFEQFRLMGGTMRAISFIEKGYLELLNASGGVILLDDQLVRFGIVPDDTDIRNIDSWFIAQDSSDCVATNCLSNVLPNASDFAKQAAGVLAIGSKRKVGFVRIYWFRPGLPQEILWAGNPEKLITQADNGLSISPRDSFKKWVEVTHTHCRPWNTADRIAAVDFRGEFIDSISK